MNEVWNFQSGVVFVLPFKSIMDITETKQHCIPAVMYNSFL